jgi:hypothetical protein
LIFLEIELEHSFDLNFELWKAWISPIEQAWVSKKCTHHNVNLNLHCEMTWYILDLPFGCWKGYFFMELSSENMYVDNILLLEKFFKSSSDWYNKSKFREIHKILDNIEPIFLKHSTIDVFSCIRTQALANNGIDAVQSQGFCPIFIKKTKFICQFAFRCISKKNLKFKFNHILKHFGRLIDYIFHDV